MILLKAFQNYENVVLAPSEGPIVSFAITSRRGTAPGAKETMPSSRHRFHANSTT